MKSNKFIIYGLILLPVIFTGACKSGGQAARFGGAPVAVTAYTVKKQNVVYYNTYPATVVALNEILLRSEVNGYITGVFFKEGSHMKKGEKLYEIDRRKYQAALNAARANVEIAESNLEKAQRDADRYKRLDEENAIAKQVVEDGMTALGNAQDRLSC